MNVLGISHLFSSNQGAALIKDGKLVAFAEEERFNRVKSSPNVYPSLSINFCLREGGLSAGEIDYVAIGSSKMSDILNGHCLYSENINTSDYSPFTTYVSSYTKHGSPIVNSNFLERYTNFLSLQIANDHCIYKALADHLKVYPNQIDWFPHHHCHALSGIIPSEFKDCNFMSFDGEGGENSGIMGVSRSGNYEILDFLPWHYSLGSFYSSITSVLGFHTGGGEGKTMGLASYGNVDRNSLPLFTSRDNKYSLDRLHAGMYGNWANEIGVLPFGNDILTQKYVNLAATAQHYFENQIISHAKKLYEITGVKNFALAGGSFLNCTSNGRLLKEDFVDNIFIQPASHDSGSALGAAILSYLDKTNTYPEIDFSTAYWGSSFSNLQITESLSKNNIKFKKLDSVPETLAKLINDNLAVAYVAGKAEVGPRALCHRSILANPAIRNNLNKINKIKNREPWRPLAPAMTEESFHDIVDNKNLSPFMLLACQVKENWKNKIPAVVHVDGSCRPQSINKNQNPTIHKALMIFEKMSGVPVFLNTSFNVQGEPLVDSPNDAILSFLNSDLDALIIEDFLILK